MNKKGLQFEGQKIEKVGGDLSEWKPKRTQNENKENCDSVIRKWSFGRVSARALIRPWGVDVS